MSNTSVIIPTYNRPHLLKRALESVANQTLLPLEVFVIQNGPECGAREVVESFSDTAFPIYYVQTPEAGAARARNLGIRESEGDWIAFLDDDDEWFPKKLEKQAEVFENFPMVSVVSCRSWEVNEQGERFRVRPEINRYPTLAPMILEDNVLFISSLSGVMIRKKCLEHVGLFDESYQICNDVDLYLRLARHYLFYSLPEPLFHYCRHDSNASMRLERGWTEMIRILSGLEPDLEAGVTREMIQKARSRYCGYFYRDGVDQMSEGRYQDALKNFKTAIAKDPLIGLKIKWSRFSNPVYRLAKPYAGIFYCRMRALAGARS
jgi:glycosyltransferase involved in cell wall biosynthesis